MFKCVGVYSTHKKSKRRCQFFLFTVSICIFIYIIYGISVGTGQGFSEYMD